MKKYFNFIFTAIIISLLISFDAVNANSITDKISVGILYGSSAVSEINVKSDFNIILGQYIENEFLPLTNSNYNEIKLSANKTEGADSCHIQYYSGITEAAAKERLAELRNKGVNAYIAYTDNGISVWGGAYKNLNDAQYAAQTCGANAEAVMSDRNSVKVSRGGEIIFIYSASNGKLGVKADADNKMNEKITLRGSVNKEYRGGMCFYRVNSGGGLTVSNILGLEEYLYSVISKEMSPSWHKEALKAQAVCARNYAITNKGKHDENGFDVCGSVCCQAYGGTQAETEQSYAPVDETRGVFLMYGGEPALTFYSSSMGNCTENIKNVWGSDYPYLASVSNEYEDTANIPNGKWENSITKAEATEIMNSKGYNLGEILSVEAIEYSGAGRVLKLKVVGTNGEKIFERESARLAFSPKTLSQKFTVDHGGEAVDESFNVLGVNGSVQTKVSAAVVNSAEGKVSGLTDLNAYSGTERKVYTYAYSGGNPDIFVFRGEGWGHGIGMSQYGAKGMAEAGFNYEQILTHYFSGTTLEKKY